MFVFLVYLLPVGWLDWVVVLQRLLNLCSLRTDVWTPLAKWHKFCACFVEHNKFKLLYMSKDYKRRRQQRGKIMQSVQWISRVLHRNQQCNNGLKAYRVTCTQYYCLSYIGCKLCKTFSFFNIPSTLRGNKMWRCVALQDWLLIWLLTSFGYKNTNEQQY